MSIVAILGDLIKSLDILNDKILVKKLHHYEIRGIVLE